MKAVFIAILFTLTSQAFAATKVTCSSEKTIQAGHDHIDTFAKISFELERSGNNSVITNIVGHIFVKSPYEETNGFDPENSYMGFFKTDSLTANPDYNPRKYVGYAQFTNFDAAHTTGLEDGMYGYLALNVEGNQKNFEAFYVFQAGDHMGGTVIFNCKAY